MQAGLGVAIEGDSVGDAGAVVGALQYPIALVVVEEGIGRAGATGCVPGGQVALCVVAHGCTS